MDVIHPDNDGPPLVKTPTVETFGIRYLRSAPGEVEAEFAPDGRFSNNFGLVQGGVLGVYLDNILGQAAYTLAEREQSLTTTALNLQFLAPAAMGPLRGSARVVKKGRRVVFVEGEVTDAKGRLLVRATASLLVIRRPRTPGPPAPTSGEV